MASAPRPRLVTAGAVALGVAAGVAHALSPLSLWSMLGFAALVWWAGEGLEPAERRRVRIILSIGIAVRIVAIIGLFVTTDHAQIPFGSLFGDEEYFIRRSNWLRNVALGIPIHNADLIYAFDEYSYTHYLYVMALLQALFGPAPYGLAMLSAVMYLAGVVTLFRLARRAYGAGPAMSGLIMLLFLPSLFAWSIAALKEPPYLLISAAVCAAAVAAARTTSIARKLGLALLMVAGAACLQAIREAGMVIAAAGVAGGWTIGWLATRPRASLACAAAAPMLVIGLLTIPSVQLRATQEVRRAAKLHWGHINTAGYSYKTLDDRVYAERANVDDMSRGETFRFLARSAVDYLTVPQPWTIESRTALAFLPELTLWYVVIALAPFGFVAGLRRDPLTTGLLTATAVATAALVAITSGNVGTLIRHRGLALPYVIWLSAAGAAALLDVARQSAEPSGKDLHAPAR